MKVHGGAPWGPLVVGIRWACSKEKCRENLTLGSRVKSKCFTKVTVSAPSAPPEETQNSQVVVAVQIFGVLGSGLQVFDLKFQGLYVRVVVPLHVFRFREPFLYLRHPISKCIHVSMDKGCFSLYMLYFRGQCGLAGCNVQHQGVKGCRAGLDGALRQGVSLCLHVVCQARYSQ